MKLCVLDAAPSQHPLADLARRALADLTAAHGWNTRRLFLPDMRIADCAGDFN